MADNKSRILEMLAAGKITVHEASVLLAALGEEKSGGREPMAPAGRKVRFLHIVVDSSVDESESGKPERVNVRVPISLIRAGMKFTSLIPEEASNKVDEALADKGIKFNFKNIKEEDIDTLVEALADLEVDINGGKDKVRIYSE